MVDLWKAAAIESIRSKRDGVEDSDEGFGGELGGRGRGSWQDQVAGEITASKKSADERGC